MYKNVFKELKIHAPFTFGGAFIGILIPFFIRNIPENISLNLFYIFHPAHVLLSAFVTTSMYKLHKPNASKLKIFIIGFVGSIGIASLSDSIIPFLGETILNLPHRELHLGFVEKWYFVNPIAIIGILSANLKPFTKLPHSLHVMISTIASLFHIILALGSSFISLFMFFEIVFLLFLSVWVPCCFSDIVFPLLFVKNKDNK